MKPYPLMNERDAGYAQHVARREVHRVTIRDAEGQTYYRKYVDVTATAAVDDLMELLIADGCPGPLMVSVRTELTGGMSQ